jgi:hypothetical protein
MNYSMLPDGTELTLRNGATYIKGPHPLAPHVVPWWDGCFCGWEKDHEGKILPNWISGWHDDGSINNDASGNSKLDIVSYALNYEATLAAINATQAACMAVVREMRLPNSVNATQQLDEDVKPAIPGLTSVSLPGSAFGKFRQPE